MKIGTIEFCENPVFAAPMEDVSEPSFRYMCKKYGADLLYSEFAASDAIVRSIKQTMRKITSYEYERPFVVQIFGKDPIVMADAAKIVEAEFKHTEKRENYSRKACRSDENRERFPEIGSLGFDGHYDAVAY